MLKIVCSLLLLAISFSSCQKLLDYYNYKDADPETGCQVKTITTSSSSQVNTARIMYDTDGKPLAIKYEIYDVEYDFTDSFTFNYTYDDLGRLTSETSDYVYFTDLIYYAYEGNSKLPVGDTVRSLYMSWVEDFKYDIKGRIIQKTARDFEFVIPEDRPGPHPPVVYKYYYDLRGNKQENMSNPNYRGLIQYTDKPSLYSLHPVWQLIHKDYSKNSVDQGETFNDKGLPLTIKEGVPNFQEFLHTLIGGSVIEYDCH